MWKKSLPLGTFHVGEIVTTPVIEITDFVPLWLWCLLFGGLVVGTAWAYSGDVAKWIKRRKNCGQEPNGPIIDYMDATYIVGRYIEPAMIDAPSHVKITVVQSFIEAFSKTTGAKTGPYEYDGFLLRNWMEANAARFLVDNVGTIR